MSILTNPWENLTHCSDCGATLVMDVDHWCRCDYCGAELPNNDYDELCKSCAGTVHQDEQRASHYEQNWHNDHGDCE